MADQVQGNVIVPGGHDPLNEILEDTIVARRTWDGNRLVEGTEALQWSSAYASQQIDFPVNIIATDRGRSSYAFIPVDNIPGAILEPLLLDPWQSTGWQGGGHTGYPMRGSDDMRLMDEELQMIQNWMLGAP